MSSIESTERSVSLWEATVAPIEFPALQSDITADVCVIGAGIAGLTAAYLLAREGRSVVVLDRAAVGGGETGQTTAHLASAMDDFFHVIAAMHGPRGASLARESHATAIDRIESIVNEEGIECDFFRTLGWLFLAEGEDPELLYTERDAARAAGFNSAGNQVDRFSSIPVDFWKSPPCLLFPNQAQFHPLR
ncbi:MAG TPA: FAD-dependent oxidoreductase, partial [Longimicrobiaceae bacterium]|nr:FAD-dependent oxidoreductase [Longimicrobiaceae bacterium]